MSDQNSQESKKPGWLSLTTFIMMAVGFAGGFLTTYTTRSSQLDQVITQIAALSNDFKSFNKEYALSHEDTAVAIKGLNQHLEYTDRRIEELEQKAKFPR